MSSQGKYLNFLTGYVYYLNIIPLVKLISKIVIYDYCFLTL
jgi:hypothetical protein